MSNLKKKIDGPNTKIFRKQINFQWTNRKHLPVQRKKITQWKDFVF